MLPLAVILTTFLLPITTAQIITPAPISPLFPRQPRLAPEPQASTNVSGTAYCFSYIPGCPGQLLLYDDCTSSYGTASMYFYCLCTNGYYDAVHSCDACFVKAGIYSTAFLSAELRLDNADCESLSYEYGPGASLTGFGGITFGSGSAAATVPVTVTTDVSRTNSSGQFSTGTVSPSSLSMPGLPTTTFTVTLNGEPTGTVTSIQNVPTTTQASSAVRGAELRIDVWISFAVACFASFGWALMGHLAQP
jgi:hypothetical protein